MGGEVGRNEEDGMTVRHGEMTLLLSHVTCLSFVFVRLSLYLFLRLNMNLFLIISL